MSEVSQEMVVAALKTVTDPADGRNVVEAGLITGLLVRGGHVSFALEVPAARGEKAEPLRAACESTVKALPGVEKVTAVLTAHSENEVPQSPHAKKEHHIAPPEAIPGVKAIIAVGSGKGGVGKSTVAANLALALAAQGLKVGILDADIYGPSVPKLLGITDQPTEAEGKLQPLEKFGIKVMSLGLLIDPSAAMVWRGPMVQNALVQMLRQVAWAPLDVLVVDLPPGTGDAQLAIVQTVPVTGAVIVSTPQDLALIDAVRAVQMFRTVHVPVFGLVENMSGFVCPHCGKVTPIFGQGGAAAAAKAAHMDVLGMVPLTLKLRETSDAGAPVVATDAECAEAKAFLAIADAVKAKLA